MTDFHSRRAFLGALGAGSFAPALASAATFTSATVPVTSRELWSWYRAQVLIEPGLAWLDTAAFGPALRAVVSRGYRARERQSADHVSYAADALGPGTMRARLGTVAAFLGASAEDIAFTSGTLEALNIVAHGLELAPDDEVLTTAHDHPSAIYPWLLESRRRGIKVVQLREPGIPESPEAIVARFAGALTPKTKVLLFSHVQYTDGTVMPVRELCAMARANNVFSVVDGAQACGLIDVQLATLGCDAYATSFHKWLNGAYGSGALYLRFDARPRIWPLTVERPIGWQVADRFGVSPPALVSAADLWPETQAKFGQASRYLGPNLEGAAIAIELQQAVNRARISARQRELAMYLRVRLGELAGVVPVTPNHPALWTAIQSLKVPHRDHGQLVEAMAREDRVVVGRAHHGAEIDTIRVSLHAYNDHSDVDRFVNALRRRL
jgi:isopenicillin-N epimerase